MAATLLLLHALRASASAKTARAPFAVLWNSPLPQCCGVKAEKVLLPQAEPLPRFVENNVTVNEGTDEWSCGTHSVALEFSLGV